jgi:hypothetical protein
MPKLCASTGFIKVKNHPISLILCLVGLVEAGATNRRKGNKEEERQAGTLCALSPEETPSHESEYRLPNEST